MGLKLMNLGGFLTTTVFGRNKFPIKNVTRLLSSPGAATKKSSEQTTVDQSDVDRHTQQKKTWWDPNGPMKPLHTYNEIRVPFIRDGLVKPELWETTLTPLQGVKILDVGCGGGILSEPLARLGAEVTGLDASEELVDLARSHSQNEQRLQSNMPNYICSTIEEHAKNVMSHYDGVVASEIIEHVQNPELFVQSCLNTLKEGGRLFVTTPNRTRLSQIGVICMAEKIFRLVPDGTHEFEKFITPQELTLMLERSTDDLIRYLSIKPSASIKTLRYKIWHLLDLPDYCNEIIVLKTSENVEIPLTELRKGNQPYRPFILEVYPPTPPDFMSSTSPLHNNMLTMGRKESVFGIDEEFGGGLNDDIEAKSLVAATEQASAMKTAKTVPTVLPSRARTLNSVIRTSDNKSDLCSCVSNTSFIIQLPGKKSKDNFSNILIKIQSDLCKLSQKLSNLENRIPS